MAPGYVEPILFRSARRLDELGVRWGMTAYERDDDDKVRRITPAPMELGPEGRQRIPEEVDPLDPPAFAYVVALTAEGGALESGLAPENEDIIDFHGEPGTFKPIRFSDVIGDHFPPHAFRDKIVVVGATERFGPEWVRDVPTGDGMDQVELDANAIATLLAGAPLRDPSPSTAALVLIVAALTPLLLLAGAPYARTKLALAVPPVAIAIVAGAWPAYDHLILWPLTSAAVVFGISTAGMAAVLIVTRRRREAELR